MHTPMQYTHNDTQHNDIQHHYKLNVTLSMMILSIIVLLCLVYVIYRTYATMQCFQNALTTAVSYARKMFVKLIPESNFINLSRA
jgi:hypothetical protein